MTKSHLVFVVLLLLSAGAYAQKSGHKIRVKLKTPYPELWEEVDFMNADTFFTLWHAPSNQSKRSLMEDVPDGQYTVRIWSVFNNHFEQSFAVKRRARLVFHLEDYYARDTSSISFFDWVKMGDSIRIYSISYTESRGIGNTYPAYCSIGKDTSGHIIRFRTDSGLIQFKLSAEELQHFKEIESSTPPQHRWKTYGFLDCNSRVFYAFRLGRQIKEVETGGRRGYLYTLFEKDQK